MLRNNEKREKWEMYIVIPGILEKTEKCGKWETHMLELGIYWETVKNLNNEKYKL